MWLVAVMVPALLMLLLLLMQWLENHLTERLIADDVERILERITVINELEEAISERTAPLFHAGRREGAT